MSNIALAPAGAPPVFLLCGGVGSRMGALQKSKTLLDVAGRPVLHHVLQSFARHGLRDFVIVLGNKAKSIRDWLAPDATGVAKVKTRDFGTWSIRFVETGEGDVEKGERIRRALAEVEVPGAAIVSYGESVADVDVPALLRTHAAGGALATVTATRVRSSFGLLRCDAAGRVVGFEEKPLLPDLVNIGYMVLSGLALDDIRQSGLPNSQLEADFMRRWSAAGDLQVFVHTGLWRAFKTRADLVVDDALSTLMTRLDAPPSDLRPSGQTADRELIST